MEIRTLNPEPARKLTSREISKVIGGVLGGFVGWCDVDDIMAAITFYSAHAAEMKKMFVAQEAAMKKAGLKAD